VHDCVDIIGRIKSFDISTSLDALELAEKLIEDDGETLRRRALQFVVANFEEVAKAERFQKLVGSAVYYSVISAVFKVVKTVL
jgi:hypothetical protein